MSLSATAINNKKPLEEEKWYKMGGGLYLVVAPKRNTGKGSKRFVGKSRIGTGKLYSVALGVWKKDINAPEEVISRWNEMKLWGKKNNRDLRYYCDQKKTVEITKLFSDICTNFLKAQTHLTESSFDTKRNRLNQIQSHLSGKELITDFSGNEGRNYLKQVILEPKVHEGKTYTAKRYRRLLNEVFNYAVNDEGLEPVYLPYRLDMPFTFEKDIKAEQKHPHLSWQEFREELIPKLSENNCRSERLVNLATKASLMTLTRVSSLVRWKWEWLDEKSNCWIIPSDTKGLKRPQKYKGDEEYNHYIPNTHQLEVLMNNLYSINGNKEHVFHSPYKGNNPFLSAQTPNDHLIQLGFKGRQDAHGFRHLASTELNERGFDELLLGKCLSHKNNQGVMKHYNDAKLLNQKRKVFETWHELLLENGLRI